MIKESCNYKELYNVLLDSFAKALFTDGPSTLIVGGINHQKISISVMAGTVCYFIRTICRKCIEPEYEMNIVGITLNPYIGGIIGGAAKYILKNPTYPNDSSREGYLGMLNGIGCEAMQDAGMNGIINRTTSLAIIKAVEGMIRWNFKDDPLKNIESIIKGGAAGAISSIAFSYLYLPYKDVPIVYVNHAVDKVSEAAYSVSEAAYSVSEAAYSVSEAACKVSEAAYSMFEILIAGNNAKNENEYI